MQTVDVDDSRVVASASPARWVCTLYFAEGAPYAAVALISVIMYQRLGMTNSVIALATSWLLLPWTLKPLWSPLLEIFWTKKAFVVATELLAAAGLALVAASLPWPNYFQISLACLAFVALCSATHDIAADGLYISSLSSKDQAAYVGWQGVFYNAAKVFAQGGLVVIAGVLEPAAGVHRAWMVVFAGLAVIMALLGLYHARVLPGHEPPRHAQSLHQVAATFLDVVVTFFQKKNIGWLLAFIVLYRSAEGQVTKIAPLFLLDTRTNGGLGLSTAQVGTIYGTAGTLAFIAGTLLGGYFAARVGLRRALLVLCAALNLPNATFLYLSAVQPTTLAPITTAMVIEQFGYGFGFVGLILVMMQEIAPGKYKTAHYAVATALMVIGLMLPGMVSGWMQEWLGYRNFFVWILLSTIPSFFVCWRLPIGATRA